jgi:Zn-dependent peptidase ImmA (M78 family)
MNKALINNELLAWALARSGLEPEALAKKLNVKPAAVDAWLDGGDKPTFVQAQKAAATLGVPFGYLYLRQPPEDHLPIPDFRTVRGERSKLDVNTRSLLSDVLYKRDWFRDHREQNGFDPLPFVGSFSLQDDPVILAKNIRDQLHGPDGRIQSNNYEDYLRLLMGTAEDVGIWVMRTGIVGNNTHRPLDVSDFRGLAIADKLTPIILINGQDSTSAQIFTFAHELAHIWLGQSGVSNVNIGSSDFGTRNSVEKFCNKVAAEFLIPEQSFRNWWRPDLQLVNQVDDLASQYRVSRIVVARRARDLNYIDDATYSAFYAMEAKRWREAVVKKREAGGGGDFFRTLPVRNGKSFTKAVVREAIRGGMLLRDAASLLGVQPGKIRELYERIEA